VDINGYRWIEVDISGYRARTLVLFQYYR